MPTASSLNSLTINHTILCPVCGDRVSITGKTKDGRSIGSCQDAFVAEAIIVLPDHLVSAIRDYLATDWKDGRDPSGYGALNAVCYIGERVAALYASSTTPTKEDE